MAPLPDLPPEWIERARAASIVEVVGRLFTVKRAGTFFRTEEHDSLVLSPRENRYHWYSKPGGGRQGQESGDPIDFLMRYGQAGGLSFPVAVRRLVHEDFPAWTPPAPAEDEEPAEFSDLAERFHRKLTRAGYAWWAGRGVNRTVVDFLGLGESNFGDDMGDQTMTHQLSHFGHKTRVQRRARENMQTLRVESKGDQAHRQGDPLGQFASKLRIWPQIS